MSRMSHADQEKTGEGQSGFHGQLRGASLWDLVQMECMALSHRVVRITTVDEVGFIYFSGGQIVHAETSRKIGEEAALEVLSWDEGSFEICDREWPARESIQCHWQSLVMRAAHERDEKKGAVSNLVAFPKGEANPAIPQTIMSPSNDDLLLSTPELLEAVRMSPDGAVLANLSNSEEFADLTAYTTQLVHLIGASFGISGFEEMVCEFKEGRCLFYTDPAGNSVGVRPQAQISVQQVKQKLGIGT